MSDQYLVGEVQGDPVNNNIEPLLFLERLGARRFTINGVNGIFHMIKSEMLDTGFKYLHFFTNGIRTDDLFVQFPILKKENNKMMFLHFEMGKDSNGWRILNG